MQARARASTVRARVMNILIEILFCLASVCLGWYAHVVLYNKVLMFFAKENRDLKNSHKLQILELESRLRANVEIADKQLKKVAAELMGRLKLEHVRDELMYEDIRDERIRESNQKWVLERMAHHDSQIGPPCAACEFETGPDKPGTG